MTVSIIVLLNFRFDGSGLLLQRIIVRVRSAIVKFVNFIFDILIF